MSLTKSSIASLVIIGLSVVFAGSLLVNRQGIQDQLKVWQYQPTAEVSRLADNAGMSDHGRHLYYASQPSIEGTQYFNEVCGRTERSTAILGCYNGERIYVYDVTDPRLNGIKEVTAAHEMLHAAHQRLSEQEKNDTSKLIEVEYEKIKHDPKFAQRMAFYARTEPDERINELHAIIGTEVAAISPELETYYSRYFSNRSAVLTSYDKYSAVFKEIEDKTNQLSASLTTLGAKIESDTNTYNNDVKALNQAIVEFNAKASGGGFTSQSQFSAERSALESQAADLEAKRSQIAASIVTYDQQRLELQAISSEAQALNRSIDSTLAPAPSLST